MLYLKLGDRRMTCEWEETARALGACGDNTVFKFKHKSLLQLLLPPARQSCPEGNLTWSEILNMESIRMMHVVCFFGRHDLLAELIRHGADVNTEKDDGSRLLHSSCLGGDARCVSLLLTAGAYIDAVDNEGRTALHFASDLGHCDCVELLLTAGACVDVVNNQGDTALHFASQRRRIDCIEALLSGGADRTIEDNDGNTPFDLAVESGNVQAWNTAVQAFEEKRLARKKDERKRKKRRQGRLVLQEGDLDVLFEPPAEVPLETILEEGEQGQHQATGDQQDEGPLPQRQDGGIGTANATDSLQGSHQDDVSSSRDQCEQSTKLKCQRQRSPRDQARRGQLEPRRKRPPAYNYLVLALSAAMILLSLAFTTRTAQTFFLRLLV